jgi:IS5 family transposase
MRTSTVQQLALPIGKVLNHEHVNELREISRLLDAKPQVYELVQADLVRACDASKGRSGLSAEQVLRTLIVKQINGCTYKQLAYRLADSFTYREFCRLGPHQLPSKSALQRDIKRLRAETLEQINQVLFTHACETHVEHGNKVRIDCTGVESPIHHPTDSSLLWDCVRVLTRGLQTARDLCAEIAYKDHRRRAKRRAFGIANSKGQRRDELYADLLKVAKKTIGYAKRAVEVLQAKGVVDQAASLMRYVELAGKVVAQTYRRVVQGEKVPANEKIVSIFEPHTDILVKGGREPLYGHKICLAAGRSGFVIDCMLLDGNPCDTTLAVTAVERVAALRGETPKQVAFDRGFVSLANAEQLKALGVEDVGFPKKKGIDTADLVRSDWVYRQLQRFRAGVEAVISMLKRGFALNRCSWRGHDSFHAYVWSAVVSANLVTLARQTLKRRKRRS